MEYVWNLYKIYKSDEAWKVGKEELEKQIIEVKNIYKEIVDSLDDFLKCTKEYIFMNELMERVYCYPKRFIDLDINDSKHKDMFSEALKVYDDVLAMTADFECFVNDNKEIIKNYLDDDSAKYYERYYDIIFKRGEYIPVSDDTFREYQSIRDSYQGLISKMNYESIIVQDKEVIVDDASYPNLLLNDDRELRKKAYDAYIKAYLNVSDEITNLYIRKLKNDIEDARHRGYKTLKEKKLMEDELPVSLIDNLVSIVNENIDIMHRFVDYRKGISKVDEFYLYDSSYSKTENSKSISFDEALDKAKTCLSVLGSDYVSHIETLKNGSIDEKPKKGKRTLSFTGITYAGIPYMCLNYTGKKSSVRTLIHELGHAIHLMYSKENNDFTYFEFSLFLTEVVAKVNEAIFNDYSIKDNINDIGPILSTQLNSIFNQIMFTEFEDRIVKMLENDQNVDKEIISNIYEELLVKYNGESLKVSEYDKYAWLRIGHLIMQEPYYMYKYSLGTMLANKIYSNLSNDEYKKKYLTMLGIGNKMNIVDSLKLIDIDLFDENILNDSFNKLDEMLNRLGENS